MPRLRRRPRQPVLGDCPQFRELLRTGRWWNFLDASGQLIDRPRVASRRRGSHEAPPEIVEQLRGLWDEIGQEVLAEHIRERPSTRPWAWWLFDAPHPRREVARGAQPADSVCWFGTPSAHRGPMAPPRYESERDYLRRLGLLTPEERAG